ncbi:hypothetical protein ACF3OH_09380 [Chryseomicrobium aureum]|uniref:hypothetical protein n=1 Tax=Chryseomicrobium aureum TaxID=1441723 RepID=UPI00370CFF82
MDLLSNELMDDVFETISKPIMINDKLVPSIITNTPLSKGDEQETKHLHTKQKVNQGDIIHLGGAQYLIITESISKRHNQYKNVIEHCNQMLTVKGQSVTIRVGFDALGKPIYQTTQDTYETPCVIGFNRVGSTSNVGNMMILENSLMAKIKKNSDNEQYVKLNEEYSIMGKNYKVSHIDNVQTGLLIVQLDAIL